jgi:hypothetical protein
MGDCLTLFVNPSLSMLPEKALPFRSFSREVSQYRTLPFVPVRNYLMSNCYFTPRCVALDLRRGWVAW